MTGRHFWAWASIIAMWIAIAIAALAGGGFHGESSTGGLAEVPVVGGVALFAAGSSIMLSMIAFRREP
jgi:hypothetical protein